MIEWTLVFHTSHRIAKVFSVPLPVMFSIPSLQSES